MSSAGLSQARGTVNEFETTYTWPDKLAITLSKPQPFTPSANALYIDKSKKFTKYVVVEGEIENGMSTDYAPLSLSLRVTSGAQASKMVLDSDQGVDLSGAKLAPGKSMKFKLAYGYTPGAEFTAVVSSLDVLSRDEAIFKTKL